MNPKFQYISEMEFLSKSVSLCHPLGLSKVVGHQNNPSKPLNTVSENTRKTQEFWVKFGHLLVSWRLAAEVFGA